jgi:hypothetical protein
MSFSNTCGKFSHIKASHEHFAFSSHTRKTFLGEETANKPVVKWTKQQSTTNRLHHNIEYRKPLIPKKDLLLSIPRVLCISGWEHGVVRKVFPETFWKFFNAPSRDSRQERDKDCIAWLKGTTEAQEVLRGAISALMKGRYFDDYSNENRPNVPEELLSLLAPLITRWAKLRCTINDNSQYVVTAKRLRGGGFREELNEAAKLIADDIWDLGSDGREGELIGALEDSGYLVKLPATAHVGDIMTTFGAKFDSHEFVAFLRPQTGIVDTETGRAVAADIKQKLGARFPSVLLDGVRHCKLVGYMWAAHAIRHRKLEKSRTSRLQVFALH